MSRGEISLLIINNNSKKNLIDEFLLFEILTKKKQRLPMVFLHMFFLSRLTW